MSHVERKWTDDQLRAAVRESKSWRETIRGLGLTSTACGRFRRHADSLGIDYSHFRGQRTWSDDDLREAVVLHSTMDGILGYFGLAYSANTIKAVRRRGKELGLSLPGLASTERAVPASHEELLATPREDQHLRRAALSMVSAWFAARGFEPSFPVETCSYDLVVKLPQGLRSVQIKSRKPGAHATAVVRLHDIRPGPFSRSPYTEDEADYLFVLEGWDIGYLIPMSAFAGMSSFTPSSWRQFRVEMP